MANADLNAKLRAQLGEWTKVSDTVLHHVAVYLVGLIGSRAEAKHQDELEHACYSFVERMHKLAGTSSPPNLPHLNN